MKSINLEAATRDEKLGKGSLNRQRKEGYIPAIVYGAKVGSVPITIIRKDLQNLLSEHGINAIINLKVAGGKSTQVMIKEIQTHPISGHYWHIDFTEVAMNKPIRTEVQVSFAGEPQGVEEGGILQFTDTTIEVECLPADIPENISMDISTLKIGDKLTVGDLKLNDKVQILSEPEQVLVTVVPPRLETDDEEQQDEAADVADDAGEEQ